VAAKKGEADQQRKGRGNEYKGGEIECFLIYLGGGTAGIKRGRLGRQGIWGTLCQGLLSKGSRQSPPSGPKIGNSVQDIGGTGRPHQRGTPDVAVSCGQIKVISTKKNAKKGNPIKRPWVIGGVEK